MPRRNTKLSESVSVQNRPRSRYGEGEGQDVLITLRVTAEERAAIKRVAAGRGVTIALLVRSGLTSMGVPGLRGST